MCMHSPYRGEELQDGHAVRRARVFPLGWATAGYVPWCRALVGKAQKGMPR